MLFGQHFCLGLAKAHSTAFTPALHTVHEIDPNPDQQKEGQERHKKRLEAGLLLLFCAHGDVVGDQKFGNFSVRRLDRHVVCAIRLTEPHLFTVKCNVADFTRLDRFHKLGIADFAALHRAAGPAEQVKQR